MGVTSWRVEFIYFDGWAMITCPEGLEARDRRHRRSRGERGEETWRGMKSCRSQALSPTQDVAEVDILSPTSLMSGFFLFSPVKPPKGETLQQKSLHLGKEDGPRPSLNALRIPSVSTRRTIGLPGVSTVRYALSGSVRKKRIASAWLLMSCQRWRQNGAK